MSRTITKDEWERRKAVAAAKLAISIAMQGHSLTPLEWCRVLNEEMTFIIGNGLVDEWSEGSSDAEVQDDN